MFISLSSDKAFHNFASIRVNYTNKMISNWPSIEPNFYIIEENSLEELEDIFRKLSTLTFNPRAKYLFIGQNVSTHFLEFIASLYIRDVLILNPKTFDLLSPFQHEKETITWKNMNAIIYDREICGNSWQKKITADLSPQQLKENWGISKISLLYFPIEMYTTCHNCTSKGILLDLFDTIADYLEIKVDYYRTEHMSEEEVSQYNVFIRLYRTEVRNFMEFTMSCLADEWSWFVPSPEPIPRWRYLYNIFEPSVWLVFSFIIFIFSVIWSSSTFIFESEFIFLEIIEAVFKLFLEQKNNIRRNSVHRAIIVIGMIFFAYFMNIFLKCRFTYLLNGLNYHNVLNSFDDIMINQMKIGSSPEMMPLLNATSEISEYIEKFHLQCDISPSCLRRSAFQKDIAVFKPARRARAIIKSMIKSNGRILLKEIEPPFVIVYNAIYFQRGHPLFPSFNKHLYNLVETGIANKIISKYDPKIEAEHHIYTERRALTTDHLVIPLVIWMAGILGAAIIFVFEKILIRNPMFHKRRTLKK
ncbi:hypothetical protein HHI36_014346 [Cryptolaemus montrouzieri]|uniref:Ionotropic receptor n=1 Tax=Cryptolaemus montrouzieri TaxID=559131 RepID=A0ABD2N2D0_9CUCU